MCVEDMDNGTVIACNRCKDDAPRLPNGVPPGVPCVGTPYGGIFFDAEGSNVERLCITMSPPRQCRIRADREGARALLPRRRSRVLWFCIVAILCYMSFTNQTFVPAIPFRDTVQDTCSNGIPGVLNLPDRRLP